MRTPRSTRFARLAAWLLMAASVLAVGACSREKPATAPAAPATSAPAAAATAAAASAAAPAAAAPAAKEAVFSREELDQMVAPIALYPDTLLAQVLMASTYPGNVADAVKWSKAHPEAKGDDAVRMVADQPWDPSVQSLVAFPQALATLGQDPGWVQRVGDAFLAQPDDLMDAVQRLRRQAQDAGNLTSNEFQKVSTEQPPPEVIAASQAVPTSDVAGGAIEAPPPPEPVIVIQPAQPETVYVPSYDPNTAYGTWAYPSYPPPYYPPPAAYYPMGGALMRGVAFGTGVAIADSLWGDTDWWGNDVDINVSHYNNINTNRTLNSTNNTWRHDPARRDGVPYRDNANRERYGRQMEGAGNRAQFRGEDANRTRQREQARQSMQQRGVEGPARSNAEARASARNVERSPEARAARERAGGDQRANAARTASDRAAADRARAGGDQRANAARTASNRAAADRARAGGGSRDAARASGQGQRGGAQARQSSQRVHASQSNSAARNSARQQQQARGGGGGRNSSAFHGASQPRASQAQAQRGRQSHASAQRSPSQRGGGGHQVQRQSPQRQQASRGGGQRSGGQPAGGGGRRR